MRIIDLSHNLQNVVFDKDPKIKYLNHKKGGNLLGMVSILDPSPVKMFFNLILYVLGIKKISHKQFPDENGLAWEYIKTDSHSGTHLDAPYHFGPLVNGEKAKTIDEIPLEWCMSDGVALDFSSLKTNTINLSDIKENLAKIKYTIKPFDIVLVYSGASKQWNTPNYTTSHKSVSIDAISWLVEKGVKIIATDGHTIDLPFKEMLNNYSKTKESKYLWPGHFIGRNVEYLHIENTNNIDKLLDNPFGYIISCLPIKIKNGSAGWVRMIAIDKRNITINSN
jgi:kynurenine formamidase